MQTGRRDRFRAAARLRRPIARAFAVVYDKLVNGARPSEFKATAENEQTLLVPERVKRDEISGARPDQPAGRCVVTTAVEQLLNSFEALSEAEQREAAVEVLRRTLRQVPPDLPEEALVEAADELFRELDAREAADARP